VNRIEHMRTHASFKADTIYLREANYAALSGAARKDLDRSCRWQQTRCLRAAQTVIGGRS